MQKLYDSGIYTGFALVVEMIERGDCVSQEELAARLRKIVQGKADDRLRLVISHAGAMHRTLNIPKNVRKQSWSDIQPIQLMDMAKHELNNEFHAALWGHLGHGVPIERVESEASDVSNFLAMIVDNCRRNLP